MPVFVEYLINFCLHSVKGFNFNPRSRRNMNYYGLNLIYLYIFKELRVDLEPQAAESC